MKSWEANMEEGPDGRERGQGAGESPSCRGEGKKQGKAKQGS